MNEVQANAVYDILVQHAGANNDQRDREWFIYVHKDTCREYRFQGSLGFGGKLYVEPDGWRVSCYPDDRTPRRQAIIDATNGALAELYAKEMAT